MPAPAWPCAAAVCRFPVNQRADLELVAGRGIAAANPKVAQAQHLATAPNGPLGFGLV